MNLIEKVRKEAPEYGSLPFWSWNDRLEPEELRRQIRRMHELGMRGFFMHARGGLETEYLSDEWFECVQACVDEAKKLGMEAWAYDENGWPSGFAGGQLLTGRQNFAVGLRLTREKTLPILNDDVLGVYALDANRRLRQVAGHGMEGVGRAAEEYLVVTRYYDFSYVDTMNAAVTEKFLAATHAVYEERVGKEDFGKAMPGFFTDEPQYFRGGTSYSDTLPEKFLKKYGYSLYPWLPALFIDCKGAESFRWDYWRLCHETFTESFVKPIYRWCEAHGVQLTGHAIEESDLRGQMMCCGGIMPFYEYEHIPGMDYLGRGISDPLASKQLGSVCAQLGKKKVLSEMFACCGWDVSPIDLKRIAEGQYAGGVNLMCQHLYPYSERGQRKRDYPCHYSEHNPWQEDMKAFDRHFNHLGALLAQGEEFAPVLVIHPMHNAYLHYVKEPVEGLSHHAETCMNALEARTSALTRKLAKAHIAYHYGDEWMMARHARVEGAAIWVGQCRYTMVVLPDMETLDNTTALLLREYLANGGRLCCLGRLPELVNGKPGFLPWLRETASWSQVLAACPVKLRSPDDTEPLRMQIRQTEQGVLLFITNVGETAVRNVTVSAPYCPGGVEILPETLETRPIYGSGNAMQFDFAPGECHVVLLDGSQPLAGEKPAKDEAVLTLDGPFVLTKPAENFLTLDKAALSTDGTHFDAPLAIEGIRDNLLRQQYAGRIWLRFDFEIRKLPESLSLIAEPGKNLTLTVNGKAADFLPDMWKLDRSFRVADILPLLHEGQNEAVLAMDYRQREEVYRVLYGGGSETLRNSLYFDTEVECPYLCGAFCVDTDAPFVPDERESLTCEGGFRITCQRPTVALQCPVTDGYPFFAGSMEAETTVQWQPGDPTLLDFTGRFAVAEITVNGAGAGKMFFTHTLDIADFLTPGENRIRIRLTCANRNLMGPFHRSDPEPFGVGPFTFSYEKQWKGRECPDYLERYAFVRFGIR